MNTDTPISPERQAVLHGLAVIGFIALVAAGIWLAVYSTRFVPIVANNVGSAAVYLGSLFDPSDATLSVVETPSASTTIPFGIASTTDVATAPETPSASKPVAKPNVPVPTAPSVPAPLYGLPDLQVTVEALGYLAIKNEISSFTENATVPSGKQPAIKFAVANVGTNVSGSWQISTTPRLADPSEFQPSIYPGDRRAGYVMYLDPIHKSKQLSTITVSAVNSKESNADNNSISFTFTLD